MNEHIQDVIIEKLVNYLQNAEEFVVEQLPDTIYQILKYEKTACYISASLMLLLLCTGLVIGYYFWKNPILDKYGSRDAMSLMAMCLSFSLSPLFFVQLCCSLDKLIKIYLAPKYFLMQLLIGMKQ